MIRDDAAEALGQAEFFDICDEEQRRMLAFASDMHQFDADAVLYKAGDMPQGAFVLVDGTLKAKPEGPGAGKPYAISEPGSVVSAMALILGKPRPVTITAVTDSRALFVPRSAFLKLANQAPDLAKRAADRIRTDLMGYLGAIEQVKPKIGSSKS